jgi:Ca-activated chloride channel family protein
MQETLTPPRMRGGSLLLRAAGEKTLHEAARHLGTDAEITVAGPVARAVVTQTFRNTGERRMEGVYAFPLPGNAVVDTLRMQIGGRSIVGEIRSRDKARKLSGQSENTGRSAGGHVPVESGPAVFTTAVPGIAPGDMVTVRIEYQQTLQPDDGVHSLRFPLAAAPQPAPELVYGVRSGGSTGRRGLMRKDEDAAAHGGEDAPMPRRKPDRRVTAAPVTLQIRLEPGFPLGAVESPSHAVAMERRSEDTALITLEAPPVSPQKDFELIWKPGDTAEPTARLFREDGDKTGYLLATITPPTREAALPEQPREVIFVLDRSGSMAGAAFRQVRDSLETAVSRLGSRDRFNIIAFDMGYEALFEKPVAEWE